jgi:hypothetical protein
MAAKPTGPNFDGGLKLIDVSFREINEKKEPGQGWMTLKGIKQGP